MGPVQVGELNVVSMILQPVPDSHLILGAVEDLNAHLLELCGIRLLMKEIISQKLYCIPHIQEHLQILVCGPGACILVISGHIMVYDQDHGLSHSPLSGPEWIGISVVDALTGKLFCPFLFQLLAVFHLIPL